MEDINKTSHIIKRLDTHQAEMMLGVYVALDLNMNKQFEHMQKTGWCLGSKHQESILEQVGFLEGDEVHNLADAILSTSSHYTYSVSYTHLTLPTICSV